MTRFFTILIALIVSISVDCMGQNLFGLNGYGTRNTMTLDTSGMKRKIFTEPGYGFGVVYKHMELKNIIGFQAEVNFDYSGFRVEPDDDLYYKQNLKYVTVPLMAHLDLGKHSVKFLFAIGTYASFLIDSPKPKTNIPDIMHSDVSRIYAGEYNFFTYGLCGQSGFAICTKAGIFCVQGRASVGMSKMMDMGELAILNYMTSRSFGIGASYLVPFGKGEKYYTKREKIKKEKPEDLEEQPVDIQEVVPESDLSEDPTAQDLETTAPEETEKPENEENWEERMNENFNE